MGADEVKQQFECIRVAGIAEEIPYHLSRKNVEGVERSKSEGLSGVMAFRMHFQR